MTAGYDQTVKLWDLKARTSDALQVMKSFKVCAELLATSLCLLARPQRRNAQAARSTPPLPLSTCLVALTIYLLYVPAGQRDMCGSAGARHLRSQRGWEHTPLRRPPGSLLHR